MPEYRTRVRFSNNFGKGDAGITLDKVTTEDNGTYECLVDIKNVFPSKSVEVELFVLGKAFIPLYFCQSNN